MIMSFGNKETEKVYKQVFSTKLPQEIQRVALRKLIMIDNAIEALVGNRKGQYSIRINQQYRICFVVKDNNYYDVEIVDYH